MKAIDGNLCKLTDESLKRKERLRRLREQAEKSGKTTIDDNKLPGPVFRSYKPNNDIPVGKVLEQKPTGSIEAAVVDQLELLQQPMGIDDIDITNLVPRKPDWDLKRDIVKKLERLERRTQKALAELILERLKKNQEEQDIFQVVNLATAHAGQANINGED